MNRWSLMRVSAAGLFKTDTPTWDTARPARSIATSLLLDQLGTDELCLSDFAEEIAANSTHSGRDLIAFAQVGNWSTPPYGRTLKTGLA